MIDFSNNILDYFTSLYGSTAAKAYQDFIQTTHNTYIRKKKNFPAGQFLKALEEYGITVDQESSVPEAYRIQKGEESAGKTLQHVLGKYYIQSLSSMIPPLILNPGYNETVLDLCAAPGSKTTQISEIMNNKGRLISNEISVDRVKTLIHNIDRMNLINIGVLNQKGELLSKIYDNYFDKVLVDAPCSALGVLQKRQEVSNWWSEERVAVLTTMQLKLLIAAIKMLKPGGELVYSTCTLTPEENELLINLVLRKYPVEVMDIELPLKSNEGFTSYKNEKLHPSISKTRRILPWEVNSEGFFIAKLRKTSATELSAGQNKSSEQIKFIDHKHISLKNHLSEISEYFGINPDLWQGYKFLFKGNDLFFTVDEWNDHNLSSFTRIGTRFGSIAKNNKMQLHSYAAQYFAENIKSNVYDIKDKQELKNYLGGGIIRKESSPGNIMVIKYNDMIIGTSVPVHNGLKSQFPKSKRMQEIIL